MGIAERLAGLTENTRMPPAAVDPRRPSDLLDRFFRTGRCAVRLVHLFWVGSCLPLKCRKRTLTDSPRDPVQGYASSDITWVLA